MPLEIKGDEVGATLKKLIALPAEKQPFISLFVKFGNKIFEGCKIDPKFCINAQGGTITVGVRIPGIGAIELFYWTPGKSNEGSFEITELSVLS